MTQKLSIFGRVQAAASILRRGLIGDPADKWFEEVPTSSAKSVTFPYKQVAAVHACVKARANAIGSLPCRVSASGDRVIESGPLIQLLERPNPKMSRRKFFRATESLICLTGACYWWRMFVGEGNRRRVVSVYPFGATKIKRRFDDNGRQIGWWYYPEGKARQPVELDEIHPLIEPDYESGDLDTPLSIKQAVWLAISQYYKADRANLSSLDNDVSPGGIVSTDESFTDDQRKEIKQSISEQYQGVVNRKRLMVLEGGLHFERVQAAFAEMEFAELKRMSRTDICSGYSVPPSVAGFYENDNYAHAEAADQMFWINTVGPEADWISEEWDDGVTDWNTGAQEPDVQVQPASMRQKRFSRAARVRAAGVDRKFYTWFDLSAVPAVQKVQADIAKSMETWIDKGIPLNQVIRAGDLPFEEVPWGDTWYKPFSLVDVNEDTADLQPPAGNETDPAKDEKAPPAPTVRRAGFEHVRKLSESQLAKLHQSWWLSITPLIRRMQQKVSGHFNALRREVLANIAKIDPAKSLERRDLIAEILFDLIEADQRLQVIAGPLFRASMEHGGANGMQDAADAIGAKKPEKFDSSAEAVQAALRNREIRIKGINTTVHDRLKAQLTEGYDKGETLDQIGERVRREFNYAGSRAKTIARTEVGAVVEEGQQFARVQAKVPGKSWLWSRKETGRPWHLETELKYMAQPITVSEQFEVVQTGHACLHPRATGEAEDDINCGCTTISRFPEDKVADARLIDAMLRHGFDLDARAKALTTEKSNAGNANV